MHREFDFDSSDGEDLLTEGWRAPADGPHFHAAVFEDMGGGPFHAAGRMGRPPPPPPAPPFPGGPFGGGPPRHGGGPFGGWGPPRRARRGDVRSAILLVVADKALHGYEIIRELEARSRGHWRPSAGSVYPTLQLLEDEGLIRGEEVDDKRVYSITVAGKKELAARARRGGGGAPPWEIGVDEDPGAFDLREATFQLGQAAAQVARTGSAEQRERALAILRDARRRMYAILAEEG